MHWGHMTHIYASLNEVIIDSGNDLSPVWCQAIICTNDDLLSIGSSETKFIEFFIEIKTFSFTKLHFKMLSAIVAVILSGPQCVKG